MGEFDRGSEDYKQYLKPKKKREVPTEPWKQKFYEEYWGQKKQTEPEEDSQNFTPISFVEIARKENPDLVIYLFLNIFLFYFLHYFLCIIYYYFYLFY